MAYINSNIDQPDSLPLAIEAINLSKRYSGLVAVDGLSLQIQTGELFGFLGPNGAGKTTTLNMLTTLIQPTSGKATICELDLATQSTEIKNRIGLMPDTPKIYPTLTGRQFIHFVASLYRLDSETVEERMFRYLNLFDLHQVVDDQIKSYSYGMQKKILLVSVLIRDPEVLFLDEPTAGLDPKSANTVKQLLVDLCQNGRTVFMATHILEIAEKVCDRIGIIHQGKLIAAGTLAELRSQIANTSLEDIFLQLTSGTLSCNA